jgi:hypothetical protein
MRASIRHRVVDLSDRQRGDVLKVLAIPDKTFRSRPWRETLLLSVFAMFSPPFMG